MDLHRLAEERSVAYHRAIAARLRERPEVLEMARRRIEEWLFGGRAPSYARKWHEILSGDIDAISEFLVDRGELATELRQSTPFAGALTPQERWAIWRRTRDEMAA